MFTIAGLLSLLLAFGATVGTDVTKRRKLQDAQQRYEQYVRDGQVTEDEYSNLHEMTQ